MATLQEKIDYNRRKAAKHGWTPEWFNCTDFDADLIIAIKAYQSRNGLSMDGMCGPSTFRVIYTEREQDNDLDDDEAENGEYIIYNDARVKIFWDKVTTYNEVGGKKASSGKFSSYAGRRPRDPKFFVSHWDVTLSASRCFRILEKRGISVHYSIDNDGRIYQWLDMQHAAWHAGGRAWNHNSVGVEVSNAYSLKYQDWYERKGFGPRPVIEDAKCHGRDVRIHLGFYEVQERALAALWEAVSYACDIPLEIPDTEYAVDQKCADNEFSGFCSHFHLTRRKIDPCSMDANKILRWAIEIRREKRYV